MVILIPKKYIRNNIVKFLGCIMIKKAINNIVIHVYISDLNFARLKIIGIYSGKKR